MRRNIRGAEHEFGFFCVLFSALLVALKISGDLDWSWLAVMSPILFPFIFVGIILTIKKK